MPTQITSAGITFNDATSFTSATLIANSVGTTQITNGSVIASKLGANEQKQICKAWVNFNGTTNPGTIRSSYNVSTVTKNGTGDYTVNFPIGTFADANCSVSASFGSSSVLATNAAVSMCVNSITASSVRIVVTTSTGGTAYDSSLIGLIVFGN